jgi:glycosyltransferase involved in cell wall biosynthesis
VGGAGVAHGSVGEASRMTAPLLISVCIPSYNRASVLRELLESVLTQDFDRFEVVVCEDASPERGQIRQVVEDLPAAWRARVRYFENASNLGYDGNVRNVIDKAAGEYCLLMGNDDLMCPGALRTVARGLQAYPDVGVVLRTYASFDGTPTQINQVFRYFDRERIFEPGPPTIVTFFRRCVVLPGLVLHRGTALRYATDDFDGSLLYQLYLVGRILGEKSGLFLPQILTLYRNGGIPDFGNSAAEKGNFVPGIITPDASLHFMASMLRIAAAVEQRSGLTVYRPIVKDLANYSYPFIAIQVRQPWRVYLRYCWKLGRLGFGRYPLFYAYLLSLLFLGERRVEQIIRRIKKHLGHTPVLGDVYQGRPV